MHPNVLMDTNIVVNYFRNAENYKSQLLDHSIDISIITLGELYSGAEKSARPDFHKNKIELFLSQCSIIPIDLKTTEIYGGIWAKLSTDGHLIPTNDMWIAATAIQHKLPLISDDKHFHNIPKLDHRNW